MASDVFVSHSIKDKAVAEAIVARLEADSVTCWIAPRDVVPGADWGESIIDAIESSRIMILIFSRNADASPQIKREVERAVNKGVYIIPFRVDDIPPTKSLEYFISTSQWMDAFSPPLERHLDNLAKTVKAVLQRPPLPGADVPAQPERPSIPTPPVHPSGRKAILIGIIIAALVLVGGAGWYLGQKKKGAPEQPAVTPIETSPPVPITPTAVTPEVKPESSTNSGWLTSAEYQREFDARKSEFYPADIEGRCHDGREEFRAVWKKLPMQSAFESHHGITKQQFEDRRNALREKVIRLSSPRRSRTAMTLPDTKQPG